MCLDVRTLCAPYLGALNEEQQNFINCEGRGEAIHESGNECFSLSSLSPIPRCGNATSGGGIIIIIIPFFCLFQFALFLLIIVVINNEKKGVEEGVKNMIQNWHPSQVLIVLLLSLKRYF